METETRGIIMFNRGDGCIIRAIVCLYTLRKHWNGPVTMYLEKPYPESFDDVCKYFNVDVIHNEEKHEVKTLQRKTEMFSNPPYDRTLWLDSDTIVVGKIDELFYCLDDADVCFPHFANWISSGNHISTRIKRFKGLTEDRYIEEALRGHPAVNTGVLSFRKSEKWTKFVGDWLKLSAAGFNKHVFISDEVSMQVLLPSIGEWGLKCKIAPSGFNTSVLHDHGLSKDIRIWHFHGKKHTLSHPNCDLWKNTFRELCDKNIANINSFLQYSDKRLKEYLSKDNAKSQLPPYQTSDVTIVSACDPFYVEELKFTFPNWRKYKKIDNHPVIIFYNGMPENDSRLDFLRLPNVTLIPWNEGCMGKTDSHRELMLSCFVLGTAEHVKTDYWIKIDADSYATNDHVLYDEDFKNYAFVGPRWGYSKKDLVKQLDEWSLTHWKRKLRNARPMIEDGKIEGSRFYHNVKRTISFVQFHKTKFSRFCVKLIKEDPVTHLKRLPAPSHDTFYYYIIQRFDPHLMATRNFKKNYGFTQAKGRLGADHIKKCVEQVDINNAAKENHQSLSESSDQDIE